MIRSKVWTYIHIKAEKEEKRMTERASCKSVLEPHNWSIFQRPVLKVWLIMCGPQSSQDKALWACWLLWILFSYILHRSLCLSFTSVAVSLTFTAYISKQVLKDSEGLVKIMIKLSRRNEKKEMWYNAKDMRDKKTARLFLSTKWNHSSLRQNL